MLTILPVERAVGIGMLAELQAERYPGPLSAFEGRADIGQALGLQHEMVQALSERQVEQRQRMVPAIAVQEVPHLDQPDQAASRSLTPWPERVDVEALHGLKVAAHQHGVAHASNT